MSAKRKPRYTKFIDEAVGRALRGNPIDMMDIQRVYDFAVQLLEDGITDVEVLDATLSEYVRTIRVDINPKR